MNIYVIGETLRRGVSENKTKPKRVNKQKKKTLI